MATPPIRNMLSLEQILEAVDHLSPTQMDELQRRLATRRAENRNEGLKESTLVRAASAPLNGGAGATPEAIDRPKWARNVDAEPVGRVPVAGAGCPAT
jgi:hypothetical protein